MIFVDFLGSRAAYENLHDAVAEEIATALKSTRGNVAVRRIVTEADTTDVELWVELSSDEQFVRYGPTIAEQVAQRVRSQSDVDVWVMFRIVPLSHAFLNGKRRTRGRISLD